MMMMMMMMMILPDIATKTCKSSIVLMVSALNIVVALRPTSVKTYDIICLAFSAVSGSNSRGETVYPVVIYSRIPSRHFHIQLNCGDCS